MISPPSRRRAGAARPMGAVGLRRVSGALAGLAAAGLLAGCGGAAAVSAAPTWLPSPDFEHNGEGPGTHITPALPIPSLPSPGGGGGTNGPAGSGSGSGQDPAVVATHLHAPVGLAVLPDDSALVGERTTGRIVQVQPRAGQPVRTVRTLRGLDTAGDGGLLDLALSPTYSQDQLIYAYVSTRTDNRVVDFTLHGPVTPVLTGIPHGRSGNAGRLFFDADGQLSIATGTADGSGGRRSPTPAGALLRVDAIGDASRGNPTRGSAVYARGLSSTPGLCGADGALFAVEGSGVVRQVLTGADYTGSHTRIGRVPARFGAPGGCAVMGTRLWITSLDGRALLAFPLAADGSQLRLGKVATSLRGVYGRLRTVVAASDGALWLTTSNRDGHGRPVPDDERVIRIVPGAAGGSPL